MIHIKDNIVIFEKSISYRAVRSSGPGGQHVNKVATGIHLQYNIKQHHYPLWFIDKLKKVSGNLLSGSGDLILKATSYRSQNRNKDDALKRLIKLFKKASEVQKKRIKTRPSLSVKRKRLDSKRKRSEKKELRKSPKAYD
tara:strand:+ start:412 stop:831 length:420 start_codon:yes stop_codon:yes gene_type:complete